MNFSQRPFRLRAALLLLTLSIVSTGIVGEAAAFQPAKLIAPASPFFYPYQFGYSVASAGDWNGDGYDDVIVGLFDDEFTSTGSAVIYFGGPQADKLPDVTLKGEAIGDGFGYSVAGAGDVNGDGYDDVVVGAPYKDANEADAGAVYVFLGGPNPASVAGDNQYDLRIFPNVTAGHPGVIRGFSVAGAGDFNADGYDDILVGVPDGGPGGTALGEADLYYGGPTLDGNKDLDFRIQLQDYSGWSVAGAGDVNGDGYDDCVIGGFRTYASASDPGKAMIILGGTSLPPTTITLAGETAGDDFGRSVSSAGDANGDGFADVIVGAPLNSSSTGRAYVYFGGPTVDAYADLVLNGTSGSQFGTSVASAGNIDGDQDDEILVGAPGYPSGFFAGRAFLYYGGALSLDNVPDVTIDGPSSFASLGTSVAPAGDFNGDGLGDFVVGVPGLQVAALPNVGQAIVFAGKSFKIKKPSLGQQVFIGGKLDLSWVGKDKADGYMSTDGGASWSLVASNIGGEDENRISLSVPAVQTSNARVRLVATGQLPAVQNSDESPDFRIVAPTTPPSPIAPVRWTSPGVANERRGFSVASAGDFNGDGYPDEIVGAPADASSGSFTGRAYVYFGGPTGDNVADRTLQGTFAGEDFGYAVAGIGDLNGDGYEDVAVGAPALGVGAGKIYLFYGGPSNGDAVADLILNGVQVGEGFGASVARAGDLNGDGFADLIAGAPYYSVAGQTGGAQGLVRIYLGGPSLDAISDFGIPGIQSNEQFGTSVAGGGDENGDSFADFVVGAPYFDGFGGQDAGRVAAYFGARTLDNVADGGFEGDAAFGHFGLAVAFAGDMNGDGLSDVAIGAPGALSNRGRVSVYINPGPPDFGISPGPPETSPGPPDIEGEVVGDLLGSSLAGIGDLNGDGLADLAIGAPLNGANGSAAGRVYVILGTTQMDMRPGVVLTGQTSGDRFGTAIAAHGASRCCNFGALVVGADQGAAAGATAGLAALYDFSLYKLVSPKGGESWPVGALRDVKWLGSTRANLELSVDGGVSWSRLAENCGGQSVNQISLRVPHTPGKFALVRVSPGPPDVNPGPPTISPGPPNGVAVSDSFFTIQTSVALLALLAAPAPAGHGVVLTWSTDPGPADLAGYRIERDHGDGFHTLAPLVRETTFTDDSPGAAARYRLYAVNGLGEEVLVGETSFAPRAPLAAWPLPFRGGSLSIDFATFGGLGGGAGAAQVDLYDVSGRLVKRVVRGAYVAGRQTATWDGNDDHGQPVASGIYFLRASSAGEERKIKIAVLR